MPNIQERNILLEPYFSITLNGSAITEAMLQYVTSVTYEDEEGKAGVAHITIEDAHMLWMNDSRIVKGAKIALRMGHRNNNRLMLNGKIGNVEADFPETGYPTFTIVAIDSGVNLTATKRTRSWKKKKKSDVLIAIFKENGVSADIADSKTIVEHIAQSNETDMDFAKRTAKELGWYFYKTPTGAYYAGPTDKYKGGSKYLDYRKGGMQIISFSPSFQEETEDDTSTDKDISSSTGKSTPTPKKDDGTAKKDLGWQITEEKTVDKSTGEVKTQTRVMVNGRDVSRNLLE